MELGVPRRGRRPCRGFIPAAPVPGQARRPARVTESWCPALRRGDGASSCVTGPAPPDHLAAAIEGAHVSPMITTGWGRLLAIALVTMGISHTIARERIFAPLRDRLGGKETW